MMKNAFENSNDDDDDDDDNVHYLFLYKINFIFSGLWLHWGGVI